MMRRPPHGALRTMSRVLDVMQFIRDNHTRKLTVSVLAKRAGMSPSQFAHRFPRVALLSPMKYEKARDPPMRRRRCDSKRPRTSPGAQATVRGAAVEIPWRAVIP